MGNWLAARRADSAALAIISALTLIFFWPVTSGIAWIPQGGGDLASFLWPIYSYAARSLWSGRVPLWNPTLYSGMPFVADNQTAVFYPVNLVAFLIAPSFPYAALEWLVVFHFGLAGAGMYRLVRRLLPASAIWPALLAAIAYMFSDVFITHVGNLNIVAVAAWLPWAFGALHEALHRSSPGWAIAAGVLVGVAALAGHAQMLLMSLGVLGLYTLWHTLRSAGRRWAPVGLLTLALGVAFGLSALTIIPAIELTQYTARARLTYESAAQFSLPWAGLAGLFSPLTFGRGALHFWAPWDRVELGYLGVLPLLLAGYAVARSRQGLPAFMLLLAAVGLLVALGHQTPLHRWLYQWVPGFAQLRVPARFILVTDFALAVLAAHGWHHLPELPQRWRLGWGGALLIITASASLWGYTSARLQGGTSRGENLGWALGVSLSLLTLSILLAWRFRPSQPWAGALASGLLALDLIGHGAWIEADRADPTAGFQFPLAVEFLQSREGPTRINNASSLWAPDAAARAGLEDIDGLANPLGLAAYRTYLDALEARGTRRYDFLNVQWVIAEKGLAPSDDPEIVPVFADDPHVDVYLNMAALPRVTLVYSATAVPDGEAAFRAITAPGFDPAAGVILETSDPLLARHVSADSNLYYLAYAPESFSIVVRHSAPAYLVFSEVWYPGWRAWVDDVEVPVLRANFTFRAVALATPGEQLVRMQFDPPSWKIGLAVTLATLLGCLTYGGWKWRRR
jgi:hypothetical protein